MHGSKRDRYDAQTDFRRPWNLRIVRYLSSEKAGRALELVELDHTETIRGICAKFYNRVPATICLNGGVQDDLCTEKEALMDYLMNDIWRDFQQYLHGAEMPSNTELAGDMISGVCYLDEEAVRTLKHFMWEFQKKYSKPRENAAAWEVALLAFPGNRDDNQ